MQNANANFLGDRSCAMSQCIKEERRFAIMMLFPAKKYKKQNLNLKIKYLCAILNDGSNFVHI